MTTIGQPTTTVPTPGRAAAPPPPVDTPPPATTTAPAGTTIAPDQNDVKPAKKLTGAEQDAKMTKEEKEWVSKTQEKLKLNKLWNAIWDAMKDKKP